MLKKLLNMKIATALKEKKTFILTLQKQNLPRWSIALSADFQK